MECPVVPRVPAAGLLAYVMVGLPTRTRPPECLLFVVLDEAKPIHTIYDRRRKDPHLFNSAWASLIEDWRGYMPAVESLGRDPESGLSVPASPVAGA
ncbi:predicted protein [Arabidopsis lyrata subsp. lyrata]|uniref:Predicted protein n=1 Tax=Arabidopsis lyrata subsp. lyrata TaxID=81972 RepID=D7MHY7_ARALL|nr:predicted protein [Arabidopsis lyrata subsp. lyrata]